MENFPLPDIGNITATAVLGWYAWHTASRTVPELVDAFRNEMNAARAEHREDREALCDQIAAERDQRHADNTAMLATLHELNRQIAHVLNGRARSEASKP